MAGQDLAGRTALVTGSTSGIGKATAIKLGGRGAHVLVTGRREQLGEAVADAIRAAGGKADFVRAELTGAASARDLAERALAAAGGHIDILVNNAGIGLFAPTAETVEENWDKTFSTNIKGHFFLVAALAPRMAAKGGGAIVNVSTMAGQMGIPGMGAYGATKAGLNLLTKSWAAEFGPSGVRVNAVSPGTTRTETVVDIMGEALDQLGAQSPLGYVAQPEQIADAIAWLVSDEASYVSGALLNVDGGRTAV
jgi:NAD(P)-dependent dehydrogenase (short-subunit alcohol dehydrogenase family)